MAGAVRSDGAGPPPPQPHCPLNPTAPQSIEFGLDSIASLQHKGFTIEPTRGTVERGQTKTISISWVPPADFDVGVRDLGQGTPQKSENGGWHPCPPGRVCWVGRWPEQDNRPAYRLKAPSSLSHFSRTTHSLRQPCCSSGGL